LVLGTVALVVGRLGLNSVSPVVAGGQLPARAVVGEHVPVSAIVFREGHDAVGASVAVRKPSGGRIPFLRMEPGAPGTDRWHATIVPDEPGLWTFVVEAWGDPLSTWRHAVTVKLEAGQGAAELANDLEDGARLFDQLTRLAPKPHRQSLAAVAAALRDGGADLQARVGPALEPAIQQLAHDVPVRDLMTRSARHSIWVDRPRALQGAWYEFFPRSIGAVLDTAPEAKTRPLRHGTLKDATEHLDYVAGMGFDVVYLPPIHPIGEVNRKGPNNSLLPAEWDVGSPWAIGSKDGGHDAIHPDLGTLQDFRAFVKRAKKLGMEVALDLALQAAPDHPWVTSHPEWFTTRPDGTIAYAENPPKKYQDIYPLNFDNDSDGLYAECLRIVLHWVKQGVSIFRVDNPHTKPINFWHWLIWEVKKQHPDVLFLAEAFTKPAMMHELARIGFTQSYTYFTWRNEKDELQDYVRELVESADYMRPNFFPTTPDILPEFLQVGGPASFRIRAILAATMSPTYGIYSGFELFEHTPVRQGSEEFLDSEKYQLRPRDVQAAVAEGRSLAPLLTQLNRVRRAHPSLLTLRGTYFHLVDNRTVTAFSKHDPATGDRTLVVCTMDPYGVQEGWVALDMPALGLDWSDRIRVTDLLTGDVYDWGTVNFVRLDPHVRPAHVFHLQRTGTV
jgi:starch synthase (maltosyl-transferring)